MAIRSRINLYPGVNPHLNSFLQAEDGGWESFHAEIIVQLRIALDRQLPSGYLALAEKSLQISEISLSAARTKPDVMIYQTRPTPALASGGAAAAPAATYLIADLLDEEETLTRVVIYQSGEGSPFGRPITRIEILFPGNKPGGTHHPRYQVKRLESLQSGLRLVEIDFLHETRPILSALPSYPDRQSDAYPYMILVSDPRPSLTQGQTQLYGFGVADPIPAIAIPLAGADVLVFDFGLLYQQVYESLRLTEEVVDYTRVPNRFDRYNEHDQAWIRVQMARIAAHDV